jgi:hypothetical protein
VVDAREWIAGLGPELAVQARLLDGLLTAVGADPRWEWLELGCSVANGRGDELSDLDLGIGYLDEAALDDVSGMLRGLGPVVDLSAHPYDGVPRWWVQYANGGQIDLVALPAGRRPGLAPGGVALLDRAGRLAVGFTPSVWRAGPDDPRHWLMDGWEALSNIVKYVRRGSLLEAVDQLHRARERIFQLWAVGGGVAYPVFGITSLLDEPQPALPPGIEAAYAVPERGSVVAAARAAADLLHGAGVRAGARARSGAGADAGSLDSPLRAYVGERLRAL